MGKQAELREWKTVKDNGIVIGFIFVGVFIISLLVLAYFKTPKLFLVYCMLALALVFLLCGPYICSFVLFLKKKMKRRNKT